MDKRRKDYLEIDLSSPIKRLSSEEHPKIMRSLREIENIVMQFEARDPVIPNFLGFKQRLTEHIAHEDHVIFPKILRATQFDKVGLRDIKERLYTSELSNWIAFHSVVREELNALATINDIVDKRNLHELTGNYFREFESLLLEHAKYEDEVLFPAVLKFAINDINKEDKSINAKERLK